MSINSVDAARAYVSALRNTSSGGMEPRQAKGEDFAALLGKLAKSSVAATEAGERATIGGLAGTVDVADVVTAVTNAELALQTVVAVRDRVIQAYQEIVRMPI